MYKWVIVVFVIVIGSFASAFIPATAFKSSFATIASNLSSSFENAIAPGNTLSYVATATIPSVVETTVANAPLPTASSVPTPTETATAPVVPIAAPAQYTIAQQGTPIVEAVTPADQPITEGELNGILTGLSDVLSLIPAAVSPQAYSAAASIPLGGGPPNTIAAANAIDQLSGVTITNANLTASEIPALDYLSFSGGALSGPLSVPTLNASSSVFGNITATNATSTSFFATTASSTNLFSNSATLGSLILGSATTSAGNGINLASGCFSVNGVCLSPGMASITGTTGQIADFSGTNTAVGTSSVFIGPSGFVGIGNTSPAEPLDLGANTSSGDDAEILINRTATNPLGNGGSHAVRDESTYQQSSGTGGYASFDAIPTIVGSIYDNHEVSFQARPQISLSSSTVSSVYGLTYQPTVNSNSTVTGSYGLYVDDALGSGSIGAQYGVWCNPLTRGTANYCIYNEGTSPSYFDGPIQLGTSSSLTLGWLSGASSGTATYGAVLSHDGYGNVLDNPGMTIVNGVLTIQGGWPVTAKVLASGSDLQLESTSGNILMRPSATTVGTWSSTGLSVNGSLSVGTTTAYSALEVWGPNTASTSAFAVVNSASTTEFTVYDTGNATLAGSLAQNSDERLKTNIQDLDGSSSLAEIEALNPVTFNWIDPAKSSVPQYGFIAQQVQSIFPNLVSVTAPTALTPDGTLSLNYIDLISPIVAAIQQLDKEIALLASTVAGFAQSITTTLLSAQEADVQKLCVGSTCVTPAQFQAMVAAANQSASASASPASLISVATDTPPVIAINGDNPAIVQVGASYSDLGATISGPQADLNLGITTFVNGLFSSEIFIDTSQPATDTIDYVVTDQNGLTSTSTRTVLIVPETPPASVSTTTAATSSTSS
jgi:hypothetical protein